MATIIQKGNKLILKCSFTDRDKARSVPCGKWNAKTKEWSFPATSFTACNLREKFNTGSFIGDAKELLNDHNKLKVNQLIKTSNNLETYPSKIIPWNHQKQAFHFLKNLDSAGIFMEMGTGKTKVAVDLVNYKNVNKILVVCPKRVINVWKREIETHSLKNYNIIILEKGNATKKAELLEQVSTYERVFVVINYDMVWREPIAKTLFKFGFEMIIADEMHRIKSPKGRASNYMHRIGKETKYKLGLTGTPIPNSPIDIYAQYRFIEPTIFGTNYNNFLEKYTIRGGYEGKQIIGFCNQEELTNKIYQIAFRVKSKDVLDLPQPINESIYFDLDSKSRNLYNQILKKAVAEYNNSKIITENVLVQLVRLQQITSGYIPVENGFTEYLNTAKQDLLKDILLDTDKTEHVIAFYRFVPERDSIKKACKELKHDYFEMSGQVNTFEAWKKNPGGVIAVQIQSGGEGEDFTISSKTVYYGLSYSLKDYLQSKFRTLRPGQSRQPIYYHLLANDTVDEKIMQALIQKKNIANYILEDLST